MTPKERARLRGLANGIDTVLQIGKDGIGENLIRQADITLEARELIKGRVLDGCVDYTPRTAAETLAEATRSEVVQVIGSKFVLYRKKSEEATIRKAEAPKKHAKPCQRKRAQMSETRTRPDKTPSAPRHGGPRKPSTENRAGQRKPSTANGNGPRKVSPNRSEPRKAAALDRSEPRKAAANRDEPRRASALDRSEPRKASAANRDGQRRASALDRNGPRTAAKRSAYGGNNRPTRNGENRPTRNGNNRPTHGGKNRK
ncbi:MAG: YhbY family RNA-binding protein [Oscillibacter sp.]|nr:YhbY family RNA-binding protein [Oscillibacter sp.]